MQSIQKRGCSCQLAASGSGALYLSRLARLQAAGRCTSAGWLGDRDALAGSPHGRPAGLKAALRYSSAGLLGDGAALRQSSAGFAGAWPEPWLLRALACDDAWDPAGALPGTPWEYTFTIRQMNQMPASGAKALSTALNRSRRRRRTDARLASLHGVQGGLRRALRVQHVHEPLRLMCLQAVRNPNSSPEP